MIDVPGPRPSDSEEIAAALRAARTLWACDERAAAIGWVRRASKAATDASDADRALELEAIADDLARALAEWLQNAPADDPSGASLDESSASLISIDIEALREHSAAGIDAGSFDDVPTAVRSGGAAKPLRRAAGARAPLVVRREPVRVVDKEIVDPHGVDPEDETVTLVRARGAGAASGLVFADLDGIEALADLPDDARERLAREATVTLLSPGEQAPAFSLAVVLRGEVELLGAECNVPADRVGAGQVVKVAGSLAEVVGLRLVATAESARVATWASAAVDPVLASCPWVDDELRAHADRNASLIALTLGPLGAGLEPEVRAELVVHLGVRLLVAGEAVFERAAPVTQLVIVGQGVIELLDADGVVATSARAGALVFSPELMSADDAPATARAGAGGALVLVGDRAEIRGLVIRHPSLGTLLV